MGYISVIRKVCNLSLLSVLFLLASVPFAWANNAPGPMLLQAEMGNILALAGCSLLGGYYEILNRQQQGKKTFPGVTLAFAAMAILWSFTHEGAILIVTTLLSGIALIRSFTMLSWGADRCGKNWPDHLEDAVPWRLFLAGTVLMVSAVFFCGMVFAFHSMNIGRGIGKMQEKNRLERFHKIITYQIAYGQLAEQESGLVQFHNPSEQGPYPQGFMDGYFGNKFFQLELTIDEAAKKFSAYLPPSLPFPPYNSLTSVPAYHADETGAIQMIRIQNALEEFPKDAPVVQRISTEEIEAMKQEILEMRLEKERRKAKK